MAVDGADFLATYAVAATYCLRDTAGGAVQMLTPDATVPPVWAATPVAATVVLAAINEPVIVFLWDGVSDLIEDVDYVYYGPSTLGRVNKTGLAVDGPDVNLDTQAFLNDTPAANQAVLTPAAAPNNALRRLSFVELGETSLGGNNVAGDNETSEPWNMTFVTAAPSPGTP